MNTALIIVLAVAYGAISWGLGAGAMVKWLNKKGVEVHFIAEEDDRET